MHTQVEIVDADNAEGAEDETRGGSGGTAATSKGTGGERAATLTAAGVIAVLDDNIIRLVCHTGFFFKAHLSSVRAYLASLKYSRDAINKAVE